MFKSQSILLFCFSFLIYTISYSQVIQKDTLNTLKVNETLTIIKRVPSPKRALLYSLVIPGAGQVYNGDWWKVPIIYGAMGGMYYLVHFNYTEYNRYKTARDLLLENQPNEFPGASEASIRSVRDFYRSNFELSCVGLGVAYILQGIEAFVAAHLKTFDVDDDLSFKSYIDQSAIGPVYGFSFKYPLSKYNGSR